MKQTIPINTTKDGNAPCVPSHYYKAGFRDFMPKLNPQHIPHLAILEIEMVEPKIIQKVGDRGTNNYSVKDISNTIPANPMSDRG